MLKGLLISLFLLVACASFQDELNERVKVFQEQSKRIPPFPLTVDETIEELKQRMLDLATMDESCLTTPISDVFGIWLKQKDLVQKVAKWTQDIPQGFFPPAYKAWTGHIDAVLDKWRADFKDFPAPNKNSAEVKVCWR
jgi:hypothetical protein